MCMFLTSCSFYNLPHPPYFLPSPYPAFFFSCFFCFLRPVFPLLLGVGGATYPLIAPAGRVLAVRHVRGDGGKHAFTMGRALAQ